MKDSEVEYANRQLKFGSFFAYVYHHSQKNR